MRTEYYLIVILKQCYIEETAQLYNFKVRAMNINIGLKSRSHQATVPTPLGLSN